MSATSERRLGAVLLAGGASRRFGAENKLLAKVGGQPIVAKVAREIAAGGVAEIVVVTGAEHEAYVSALSDMPVRLVANGRWNDGIGSSIATGVRALSATLEGAFVVPGDLPNLEAGVFRRLGASFAANDGRCVIVPVNAEGAQRNPVLWPRSLFPALAALTGAKGGKALLETVGDRRVDVTFDEEALFADIDTPDEYARLIAGA